MTGVDFIKQQAQMIQNTKLWQKHGKAITTTLNEWMGPLAVAIGFSVKFLVGIKAILAASELVGRSLEAWSRVQYYTPSFAKLLGGMSQAKSRLAELVRMSASGPFKFDSLVAANRRMEILTRGAYSGKKAMQEVADAAAAAGIAPEQAAEGIAGAMQAIARHEGVDGALDSLGQMGIVTQAAADGMRNLARSGAGEEQMLAALHAALGRNKGAAAALGDTLVGLSQQMAGAGDASLEQIGGLFAEGKTAGMKAGLELVKAFGPVLVDLMKPTAALFNAWNQLMLAMAKVAAWEPVKAAIKAVLVLMMALAASFAAKGLQILIRDLWGLGKVLGALVPAWVRSIGVMKLFGAGLQLVGTQIFKTAGGLTALLLILTQVADMMGAFGKDSGGGIGDAIAKSAEDIKRSNAEVQEMLKSGGGLGDKADVMQKGVEAAQEATQARMAEEKKRTSRGRLGQLAQNVAMGAAIGGRWGWWGAGAGAVAGAAYTDVQAFGGRNDLKNARASEREAGRNLDEAFQMNAVTPAQFLNDPDYARAKAEGEEKMVAISEKLAEAMQMAPGKGREDEIARLGKQFAAVANGVQPAALEKAFNLRMAATGTQATMMRSIGEATGDRSKTVEADRIEAGMRTEARAKELKLMGVTPDRADKMARAEGLAGLADILRANGQVFASGRSSVGIAVGEAAGGVPPEFRAVIDEIKKIQEELAGGNEGAQQERVRGVMEEGGS